MDKDVLDSTECSRMSPWRSRSSGTSAMPLAIASTRARDLDRRPLDEDLARALAVDAEQNARQRAASAAEQARDADDFAGVEREIDRNGLARTAQGTDFEERRAARGVAGA